MSNLRCCNCGDNRFLRSHFIVPIEKGGEYNDTNMVYLCSKCYRLVGKKKAGRPEIISFREAEKVLSDYFHCKMSTEEAMNELDLTSKNRATWQRLKKEYKSAYQIKDNKNNIDLINSKGIKITPDKKIGYIIFNDNVKITYTGNNIT